METNIKGIRGYNTEYKILRNVSNSVIIAGLPITLAIIYCMGLFFPIILLLILSALKVNAIVTIAVPFLLGFSIVVGVKTFYKKFGINGFFLYRRDLSLFDEIKGDMPVQDILRNKIENNK